MISHVRLPVIHCEPAGENLWRFWCQHCDGWHMHGGIPDADGMIGHRLAHCHVETSPYLVGGYFIRPLPAGERLNAARAAK